MVKETIDRSQVIALYNKRYNVRTIAKKANCSVASVYRILKERTIDYCRKLQKSKQTLEIIQHIQNGESLTEIGKIYGISRQRIYFIKKQLNKK